MIKHINVCRIRAGCIYSGAELVLIRAGSLLDKKKEHTDVKDSIRKEMIAIKDDIKERTKKSIGDAVGRLTAVMERIGSRN